MRRLAFALILLAAPAHAQTRVISDKPASVAVAIYHEGRVDTASLSQSGPGAARSEGLAVITETRTVDLPAGPSLVEFRGVAATLVPQTADISGVTVAERNFDFHLLSPGSLIEKSVGAHVHLVRTDRKTGAETTTDAVLRSGPGGMVLQTKDGMEALGCSGLPERLVFDRVPDGLTGAPTLSAHINALRAGRTTITLRYIATGMNWSADYVARIARDDRTLDLSGWLTLANFSESGFANVPVAVIAGRLQTTGEDTPPGINIVGRNDGCWPIAIDWWSFPIVAEDIGKLPDSAAAAPAPMAMMARAMDVQTVVVTGAIAARDLGDYKLYALPQPTTVAARQTKQVQFLDQTAVPFTRIYRIAVGQGDFRSNALRPAAIILKLQNSTAGRLGKPLPAGGVLAMTALESGPVLTGRGSMADVPVGAPVEIADGSTTEVSAQTRVIAETASGTGRRKRTRDTVEVTVTNRKAVPVNFEWRLTSDGLKQVSESRPHQAKDAAWVWSIPLKPGEDSVLQYTFER